MPLNNMTPKEFLLAHRTHISRMMRDATRLSAGQFREKYGVRAGALRAMLSRLNSPGPDEGEDAAAIIRQLIAIFQRTRAR
jgi:hypothetical protein